MHTTTFIVPNPNYSTGIGVAQPQTQQSPLFNGNMSSMGGNGAKIDYPGVPAMGFKKPYDMIPADAGGGCVTDGPFKK